MNDTVTKLLDYAEGYARAHTYGSSNERHAARQALQDELTKLFNEKQTPCNIEQPVNLSSTVLAHTADRLMQIPYTTMDIPSVTVAKHTHLLTHVIRSRIELEQFFKEYSKPLSS